MSAQRRDSIRSSKIFVSSLLSDIFKLLSVFADDGIASISEQRLENVLKSLEKNSMLAIRWFENNYMKLNTDKCHLIVSGYKHEKVGQI